MAIVAVLLFVSLGHGLPYRYVPDDSVVKCALGMARDAGSGEVSKLEALVPPAGRYTTYPYLLPYLSLGAIGVRFGIGKLTGEWGGAGAFAEAVFDDASLAWLPVRVLSALLGLLLPWAVYRCGRELRRPRNEAALAALLAGTSLLFVQYAHTTRPWAALVAFGAVTLAFSLRLRRKHGVRPVMAAFACAALAAATHPLGLLAFGLPVLAALLWPPRGFAWPVGLATGAAVATLLGYPALLVHGSASGAGAIADPDAGMVQIGGQAFDVGAFGGQHLVAVARSWLAYDPVLIVCGLLGFCMWRGTLPRRAGLMVVLPAAGFIVVFLLYDGTHVRYLMPAVPALALGAAALLTRLARRRRGPAVALAVVLCMFPIVQAARLDWVLGRTDTRTLAASRIVELTDATDVLAVDGFGSYYGPPLMATADSLSSVRDEVVLNRSEERWIAAGGPPDGAARAVVPIARYYRFDSYYPTDYLLGADPLEVDAFLSRRSVNVFVQVDRIPDEARRQPLTDVMTARGRLLGEVSPTGSSPPGRSELPTDMGLALLDVWRYERPGPWVRIWALEAAGS